MWSPPHYHHNTCHKNNLNLCVQNEPVTVGADATVYVWFLGQICVSKSQTYTVTSALCMQRFRLCLGQCTPESTVLHGINQN